MFEKLIDHLAPLKWKLPAWARIENDADGEYILVHPDNVYPRYIEDLRGIEGGPVGAADQYWIEVARRCMTKDLREIIGRPFRLRIARDDNWRLDAHQQGRGPEAGAAEFRRHWNRLNKARREREG